MPAPNAPAKLLEPNLPPRAYWLVALLTAPSTAFASCCCRNGLVLCPAIPVSKPVAAFCCPAAFVTPDVSAVRFPAASMPDMSVPAFAALNMASGLIV